MRNALFACLVLTQTFAFAESSDIYEMRKQDFIKAEEKNRSVLSDLYRAQQTLKKINGDKNKLVQRKEKVRAGIDSLNPVLTSAEQKILNQKIEIQKRLQYIVKFQDMSLLKIVFSSQSPSELDRNLRILRSLTERDYTLLKTYFKNVAILKNKKDELLKKQHSFAELEKQIAETEKRLKTTAQNKNKMLAKIDRQKSSLLSRLQQIREKKLKNVDKFDLTDQKREQFLSTLLEPLFFERKGSIESPANGQFIQKFGYFSHPTFKTKIRHKGLFIGTDTFSEIKSIARGRVVYLNKDRTSGNTIILDHSDHYYSVYSYIDEPLVKEGDPIEEGQLLAKGVRPHPFFGEGLYFELRHFSEPVDPIAWLQPGPSVRSMK